MADIYIYIYIYHVNLCNSFNNKNWKQHKIKRHILITVTGATKSVSGIRVFLVSIINESKLFKMNPHTQKGSIPTQLLH